MNDDQRAAVAGVVHAALLPHKMAHAVRPILRQTPEYEAARAEGRARKWLEDESLSLGYALAEVVTDRLESLEP